MPAPASTMAERQGATPPAWLARHPLPLFLDALGDLRQNRDKLVQLASVLGALFRPSVVRARLARLRAAGHVRHAATLSQLLVAARDQIIVSAVSETREFYRSQGIPWTFHNLRRFLSGPATMIDPVGFLSPRDAIVHHVLQTFHRHPVYDMVLLCAHEGGVEELARQVHAVLDGTHPHQRALASLIEDGSYHARLPHEVAAFQADPHVPARPIPEALVDDPSIMLAMDQFKDVPGFVAYASRLPVTALDATRAWLAVAFDQTLGALLRIKLSRGHIRPEACEPDLVALHLGTGAPGTSRA